MANFFRKSVALCLFSFGLSSIVCLHAMAGEHLLIEAVDGGSTNAISDRAAVGTSARIQMRTDFVQGQIFYTLDGSAATFASPRYSAPLPVSSNFVLRAIAYNVDFSQSEARTVEITALPTYQLTLTGDPGGLVEISPSLASYPSNAVVSLTARDANGWFFKRWTGNVASTNRQLELVMNSNKQVAAEFESTFHVTSTPGGHVELNPPTAPLFKIIRLTAVPDPGFYFAAWGGALNGNQNPIGFPLLSPTQTVSAAFAPLPSNQATLTVLIDGHGIAKVTPQKNLYNKGETATIQTEPPIGDFGFHDVQTVRFSGWSGDASGFEMPLFVFLDESKIIRGTFEPVVQNVFPVQESDAVDNLPAIGEDGAVYVTDATQLISFTKTLETNWVIATGLKHQTIPSIGPSRTIYIGGANGDVVAVNQDGSVRWRFSSGEFADEVIRNHHTPALAIAADETIYSGSTLSGVVYVIRNGQSIDTIPPIPTAPLIPRIPVIGPDGTLYLATTNGFAAQQADGTVKWSAPYPRPSAIDANGRLYSLGASLAALDFSGNLHWLLATPPGARNPVVAEDGKVVLRTDGGVAAISTNGQILWTNSFRANIAAQSGGGVLALGVDDPIRYASQTDSSHRSIRELSSDGQATALWLAKVELPNPVIRPGVPPFLIGSPVVSRDGELYVTDTVADFEGRVRHITVTKALARSSWALPWGNLRNNGRAELSSATPSLTLNRDGARIVLRASDIGAGAVLERSPDLKSWTEFRNVGEGEEITIATSGQHEFFRVRVP